MQILSMRRKREANDPTKARLQWRAAPPQGPGRFRGSLCGHDFLLVIENTGRTSFNQGMPPRLDVSVTVGHLTQNTVMHSAVRNVQTELRDFVRQVVIAATEQLP